MVGRAINGMYPREGEEAHICPDDQEDHEAELVGKGEKCLMTL